MNDLEVSKLDEYTSLITKQVQSVAKSFIQIGYLLWEVKELELFKDKGYKSIVDYAEHELGFRQASTYRFISLCEQFSITNGDGTPTKYLSSKYSNYSCSQLSEMISMGSLDRDKVNSDMTIKQIREVKKTIKKENNKITDVDKDDGFVKTDYGLVRTIDSIEKVIDVDENEIIKGEMSTDDLITDVDKNFIIGSAPEDYIFEKVRYFNSVYSVENIYNELDSSFSPPEQFFLSMTEKIVETDFYNIYNCSIVRVKLIENLLENYKKAYDKLMKDRGF